jgi:hypothetical protein
MKVKLWNVKRCDNCHAINPKCLYDNPRLCAECSSPTGFYKIEGDEFGADGKICQLYIRLPFSIKFRSIFC